MSEAPKRYCILCDFYSDDHAACFHPKAWHRGEGVPFGFGWPAPGDITLLNADGNCQWFENTGVAPVNTVQLTGRGFRFRVRKFLWRFTRLFRRGGQNVPR